ncbi:MAG: hypothetical protein GY791_03745 [Alphaproteobacteria bacterium]|nr:hypothetical protein [Alphaproteobacteria bacterium]
MGHGAHWHCIYEDIKTFIDEELPELVNSLNIILEEDWTGAPGVINGVTPDQIIYLSEADGDLRHLLLVARDKEAEQNTLVSAYPFCCTGIVHDVTLADIDEDTRGVEGRLSGTIDGSSRITFFDALYGLNRAKYQIGQTYPFRLGAIAYDVKRPDRDYVEISDPDRSRMVRQMIRAAGGDVGDGDGPLKLELDGAAMMFPIEEWEAGDYSFYAPVKEIASCELGGRTFTELQVTPLRLDNRDYDIVLYAAKHKLSQGLELNPDVDVTGAFWLQGHLAD